MGRRPSRTVVDYVVVAIAPALIIALVGSLGFFIIEVGYSGQFAARLKYVTGFFVMGAVLITRIAIDIDKQKAQLYGLALAGVTFCAVLRFIDASVLFDFVLIAVIWWTAHRLTYDCTVIEDDKQASGEGLLLTMGLDDDSAPDPGQTDSPTDGTSVEDDAEDFASIWDRFIQRRKRHHSPGITVVYFSAAALPIFGLGQIALMAQGRNSSGAAFRYLLLYVSSALALLMATSFLQLRRYLRQRRLQMPVEITGAWLGSGAVIIVVVMIACLMMPRPVPGSSMWTSVQTLASRTGLTPSKWALGHDGPDDKELASKEIEDPDSDESREGDKGQGGRNKSPNGDDNEQSGSNDQRELPKGNENSASGQETQKGNESGSEPNDSADEQEHSDSRERQSSDSRPNDAEDNRAADESNDQRRSDRQKGVNNADDSNRNSSEETSSRQSPSNPGSQTANILQNLVASIQSGLRLLYYLLVAAIVAYVVFRYRTEIFKALTQFWRDLRKLFGKKNAPREQAEESLTEPAPVPRRRFADFQNPFQTGMAQKVSIAELIRYTFDAMEAWATDRECSREEGQTPAEFALNVARRIPDVAPQVKSLALVYNRAAYSAGSVADCRKQLAALWQRMSS